MTTDDVVEVTPVPSPSGRRRRRRLVAVGVVVAVLAAGGGVAAWAGTRGGSAGSAAGPGVLCPDQTAQYTTQGGTVQIPSPPTASGTDGRLVPARAPSVVAVCEYFPPVVVSGALAGPAYTVSLPAVPPASFVPAKPDADDVALTRSHTFDGADPQVAELTRALQQATVHPRAGYDCAWIEQSWAPQYLVGLAYGDGVVWVASPDLCRGVTNGDSHAEIDVAPLVVRALDAVPPASTTPPAPGTDVAPPITGSQSPAPGDVSSGASGSSTAAPGSSTAAPGGGADPTAPPTDAPDPCVSAGDIAGNAERFVGFTPTSVTVCTTPVDPGATTATSSVRSGADAVALADALDALPLLVADQCPAIGGQVWDLLFRNADGARASVQVDSGGCGTATNGARVAAVDTALLARLSDLD